MIQLQYRIPKGMKPTTKQIAEWRESFIQGRQVPGIRIRAIDWRDGGSQVEIRERLKKPWRASVAGIVDQYAGASRTMCDYDQTTVKPMMRIWAVARMLRIRPLMVELARTRRGWHVVIEWNREFAPIETVALQAILGSDAFRETYNLVRVLGGQPGGNRWNLLFKEKIR